MCGICGIIKRGNITADDKKLIMKMNNVQKHRGPDDEGVYAAERVALGHRRLSIFDLSPAGHQPMFYLNKYVISYNGEIYNYLEIKDELKQKGYQFSSNTDTEVIMAAYDQWGIECLQRFNGFWSFALFDIHAQILILSRDRFGVKPLFYCVRKDKILFSSEIKAILEDKSVERIANENVIQNFLINGLADISEETFFKGIYRIPAGSNMIIQKDFTYKLQRYYLVEFSDSIDGRASDNDIKQFRKLFAESVRWRLRADVAVGSSLSGGLDSTSIVCQVNRLLKNRSKKDRQKTFSACCKNFVLNEKKYIDEVVKTEKVEANFVYPNSKMLMKDLEDVIYYQDEPFASMSIYASYCVMRKAKEQGITVLLDGQGADEILCGYRKSRIYYIKKLVSHKKLILALRELCYSLVQFKVTESKENDRSKIKQIILNKGNLKKEKYFLNEKFAKNKMEFQYRLSDDFLKNDFYKISLPALLRYVDRNSMAFSIEDRLPFLDYLLVEFTARLPLTAKIHKGYSKYIMRKALPMPELIRYRKDKIGFSTPDLMWIKENEKYFFELFNKDSFRAKKFIDQNKIIKEWKKIMSGETELQIFRYICLELWMEKFNVS